MNAFLLREIGLFAVTMAAVAVYIAWRERRTLKQLRAENVSHREVPFSTVMQLAVSTEPAAETRLLTSASLVDQQLIAQVNQLLAVRS